MDIRQAPEQLVHIQLDKADGNRLLTFAKENTQEILNEFKMMCMVMGRFLQSQKGDFKNISIDIRVKNLKTLVYCIEILVIN